MILKPEKHIRTNDGGRKVEELNRVFSKLDP